MYTLKCSLRGEECALSWCTEEERSTLHTIGVYRRRGVHCIQLVYTGGEEYVVYNWCIQEKSILQIAHVYRRRGVHCSQLMYSERSTLLRWCGHHSTNISLSGPCCALSLLSLRMHQRRQITPPPQILPNQTAILATCSEASGMFSVEGPQ